MSIKSYTNQSISAKKHSKVFKSVQSLDFFGAPCYNSTNILPPPLCNVPTRECFL